MAPGSTKKPNAAIDQAKTADKNIKILLIKMHPF